MIAPLLKGITLGFLLSISVGPVIFAIIRQSLNNGHRGGYSFVAGVSASDITLVLLCNIFTVLFDKALIHEKIIGVVGSFFLIVMGIYNYFFKRVYNPAEQSKSITTFRKRDLAANFFSGFFMNLLNPGALIFWIAASATIIADSQTAQNPNQYKLIVFSSCLLFVLSADISKVLLANKIREKLTPYNIHIINRISGIILILFGLAIISGILFFSDKLPTQLQ